MRGWLAIVLGLVGLVAGWLCNLSRAPVARPAAAPPPAVIQPALPQAALTPGSAVARLESDGKLILEGSLPDAAARDALLASVRTAHPAESVIDRVVLDPRVGPLGTLVLRGDVAGEQVRDKLLGAMRAALGGVRVDDQLRVAAAAAPATAQEERIRAYLADRHIEFAPGAATLTPQGIAALEGLVPLIAAEPRTRIEIQGHTDNTGDPVWNRQLSAARAVATRAWLLGKGVAPERLTARGYGDAKPIADNGTDDGRRRNRRIELDVEEN